MFNCQTYPTGLSISLTFICFSDSIVDTMNWFLNSMSDKTILWNKAYRNQFVSVTLSVGRVVFYD